MFLTKRNKWLFFFHNRPISAEIIHTRGNLRFFFLPQYRCVVIIGFQEENIQCQSGLGRGARVSRRNKGGSCTRRNKGVFFLPQATLFAEMGHTRRNLGFFFLPQYRCVVIVGFQEENILCQSSLGRGGRVSKRNKGCFCTRRNKWGFFLPHQSPKLSPERII